MWNIFLSLVLLQQGLLHAANSINNVYLSTGSLKDFNPERQNYDVTISNLTNTMTIFVTTSEVTNDKLSLSVGGETWSFGSHTPSVFSIGKNISKFEISIDDKTYAINLKRRQSLNLRNGIISVAASDQNKERISVARQNPNLYILSLAPHSRTLYFDVNCVGGTNPLVNGSKWTSVACDASVASQLVTVECGSEQKAFVILKPELASIPPPSSLLLVSSGRLCENQEGGFLCRSQTSQGSFLAEVDPRFCYYVVSPNIEARISNEKVSAMVDLNSSLYLEGRSGRVSRRWNLAVGGNFLPIGGDYRMRFISWCMSVSIIGMLMTILGLYILSNMRGVVHDHTEIPALLLYAMQSLCALTALKFNPTLLSDIVTNCRFLTLFFDAGLDVNMNKRDNALGCLISVIIIHCCGLVTTFFLRWNSTISEHRLVYSNTQLRIYYTLAFPLSLASGVLIFDDNIYYTLLGVTTIFTNILILLFITWKIHNIYKNKKVVWIWDEKDTKSKSGSWKDTESNQILTEPSTYSIFNIPIATWYAPVGHIYPIIISHNNDNNTHNNNNYDNVVSKTPQEIILTKTKKSSHNNTDLLVGLFRTSWLDILCSTKTLSPIFDTNDQTKPLSVPLTVKTTQLTGPVSGGGWQFVFEGVRVPFSRCAELGVRVLGGCVLGMGIMSDTMNIGLLCYAIANMCLSVYMYYIVALERRACNWLCVVTFGILAWTSMCLTVKNGYIQELSFLLTILMLLVLILNLVISTIGMVIVTAIKQPLQFHLLERLCNTNINILNKTNNILITMPAYTKCTVKQLYFDIVGNSTPPTCFENQTVYPSLDIPIQTIKEAFLTQEFQIPYVILHLKKPNQKTLISYSQREFSTFLHSTQLATSQAQSIIELVTKQSVEGTILSVNLSIVNNSGKDHGNTKRADSNPLAYDDRCRG